MSGASIEKWKERTSRWRKWFKPWNNSCSNKKVALINLWQIGKAVKMDGDMHAERSKHQVISGKLRIKIESSTFSIWQEKAAYEAQGIVEKAEKLIEVIVPFGGQWGTISALFRTS